jgi:predicted nucleic acid-binding protein
MVVFDATVLTLLLWDSAGVPVDQHTKTPIDRPKDRINFLIQRLHKSRTQILIPTPVLAEVLVQSGSAGMRYVHALQKATVFRIESFDTRAAIELADIDRKVSEGGDKKAGELAPWQRIKIDRQIIAIAKVAGADTLYTNDGPLGRFAKKAGLIVITLNELALPPPEAPRQLDLIEIISKEPQPKEPEPEEEVDLSAELEILDGPDR